MYYSFSADQSREFLSMPETGMGFQFIEAALRGSYERKRYTVLNAEIAIPQDAEHDQTLKNLISKRFDNAGLSAHFVEFSSVKVLPERDIINVIREPKIKGGGAIENPKETASGTEEFVRLSAFKNDKRIDKKRECLLPGSYTTTWGDYVACKAVGYDPVERYALPNELTIAWAFFIRPSGTDLLQRGFVQPANGKAGGGKEVFFETGTSAGTFLKLTPY